MFGDFRPIIGEKDSSASSADTHTMIKRAAFTEMRRIKDWVLARTQLSIIDYDPSDITSCKQLAKQLLAKQNGIGAFGSVERGRNLLRIIGDSYPITQLTDAYFENLSALLERKRTLAEPGRLLIGLGTGRTGSTALASLLASIPGACSTHENPPLIFWRPHQEQIEFHLRRFALLTQYFPLVSDSSHWWLNVAGDVIDLFPTARFVGLIREQTACVESFMAVKKFGPGSYNHWVPFGNDIWIPSHWDPTYPTFYTPPDSRRDPDRAKRDLINRYIHEYNLKLTDLAAALSDQFLMLRTEELGRPSSLRLLYEFAGAERTIPPVPQKLNARSISDGRDQKFCF